MSARTPEELCSQFTQRFSTGDLDALVALYEDDARFREFLAAEAERLQQMVAVARATRLLDEPGPA